MGRCIEMTTRIVKQYPNHGIDEVPALINIYLNEHPGMFIQEIIPTVYSVPNESYPMNGVLVVYEELP